ncbi:MAG: protein-glutamate O-methyltransferase CheR [bacterium]|nr:protein-glutamate O-methyltransferase CheR [bacterium]
MSADKSGSIPAEMLEKFEELIYDEASLRFSPSRLFKLENQVIQRSRTRGFNSWDDYFFYLRRDRQELDFLIEEITTKETYFFRLPEQLRIVREIIMPELEAQLSQELQTRLGERPVSRVPLRVWSSGCATGEEVYSLGMALLEGLEYPLAWSLEILATDLSRKALEMAHRGYYESSALEKIPEEYRKQYVLPRNGGGEIIPMLRNMINFQTLNLRDLVMDKGRRSKLASLYGDGDLVDLTGRFHIIFCRNVLIYFDFPAQQELVTGLYKCLQPGGYLFTGDAEFLHIYRHNFEIVMKDGVSFYRKPAWPCDMLKKVKGRKNDPASEFDD